MLITKRNGELETFNVNKIKQVIEWASEGLDINKVELETKANLTFEEKMQTTLIQDNLIQVAKNSTTVEEPDWLLVAGRLLFMQHWKNTVLKRGYKYNETSFYNHIVKMIEKEKYDLVILSFYNEEDINFLNKHFKFENDMIYNHTSINIMCNRYLLENELPQEMFMMISMWLCTVYEDKNERLEKVLEVYNILSSKKLSLASPILFNLRKPKANLASCFILEVDDSIEGFTKSWEQVAKISKKSGGIGCNISNIRCSGSYLEGKKGASSGVLPYVKVVNDIAVAINQGGKRAGSVTVALDIWHYDIPDFIHIQSETGEIRTKSLDIFPQLVIYDVFMNFVIANKDWKMFDPYEVLKKYNVKLNELYGKEFEEIYLKLYEDESLELVRTINARELFIEINQVQVSTGLPYLFFKDYTNIVNPNSGVIKSGNLCMESMSSFDLSNAHVCSLSSLNLAEIEEKELNYITQWGIEIIDNLTILCDFPVPEARNHNENYRTLGLGVMGLADYLARHNYNYYNCKEFLDELFETIAYNSYSKTIELGQKRGNFKKFEESKLKKGIILGKLFYKDKYIEISDLLEMGFEQNEIEQIAENDILLAKMFS